MLGFKVWGSGYRVEGFGLRNLCSVGVSDLGTLPQYRRLKWHRQRKIKIYLDAYPEDYEVLAAELATDVILRFC